MSADQGEASSIEAAIDYAVGLVGIEALKPLQREAIRAFVQGRDVFVSLPTGFGNLFVMLFSRSCSTVCAAKKGRLLCAFPR